MSKPKKPSNPGGRSDQVGYGNPPKKHQFQPGTSGNPAGRPRGAHSWKRIVDRILQQDVIVQERGREKTLAKQEVVIRSMVTEALAGNVGAIRDILALRRALPQFVEPIILELEEYERYV